MAGTRSSARLSTNGNSSPPSSSKEGSNKRKADSSPVATKTKRGRKGSKDQKTLEETMPNAEAQVEEAEQDQPKDIEMKEAANGGESKDTELAIDADAIAKEPSGKEYIRGNGCWFWLDNATYKKQVENGDTNGTNSTNSKNIQAGDSFKGKNREGEDMSDPEKALKDSRGGPGLNVIDGNGAKKAEAPPDETHEKESTAPATPHKTENGADTEAKKETSDAVEESKERADAQPSNVLEKGVIYFFTRGRVSVDEPESVQDLQRSHFVLRPLPEGAKLGDGDLTSLKNNRLIALPKKVWPKSGSDRFMVFVESAGTGITELKENFLQGSEYTTQTTGTQQQSPVTPIGEGVYAITSTGNRGETHLAYMLTIPSEPGQMQEDVGIRPKGSFALSLKNPTVKGPANASLPQKPDFPTDVIDAFRGRGWMPAEPKHLDYPNAQFLLIGEDIDGHALEATKSDRQNDDKETPAEEMEKLEKEDEARVKHLAGDDSVWADLGVSSKDYPSVSTTW